MLRFARYDGLFQDANTSLANRRSSLYVNTMAPWQATVLTLFPGMFPGPLGLSLSGRALEDGLWRLPVLQIRDFAKDKHRSVDDTPAGGGAGMVMRADVAAAAIDAAIAASPDAPRIYLSPRGKPLTQERVPASPAAPALSCSAGASKASTSASSTPASSKKSPQAITCFQADELAAMILIDACVRLLPGVIGAEESLAEESFENGLLEYPHYTRPRVWEGLEIPDVLLSGDHARIARWRREQSERITAERRPDLFARKVRDDTA